MEQTTWVTLRKSLLSSKRGESNSEGLCHKGKQLWSRLVFLCVSGGGVRFILKLQDILWDKTVNIWILLVKGLHPAPFARHRLSRRRERLAPGFRDQY